jgi:hypothetical protein
VPSLHRESRRWLIALGRPGHCIELVHGADDLGPQSSLSDGVLPYVRLPSVFLPRRVFNHAAPASLSPTVWHRHPSTAPSAILVNTRRDCLAAGARRARAGSGAPDPLERLGDCDAADLSRGHLGEDEVVVLQRPAGRSFESGPERSALLLPGAGGVADSNDRSGFYLCCGWNEAGSNFGIATSAR